MRRLPALLALMCVLSACGRTSCGSDAPHAHPHARNTAKAPALLPSSEAPYDTTTNAKELHVLEKIKARRNSASVRYVAPSSAELEVFGIWFRSVVASAEADTLSVAQAPLGFELDTSSAAFWLAGEQTSHKRGAGAFVVRVGPALNWVVQAPHTFFDVGTLEIAVTCFEVLNARALLINTVRRSNSNEQDIEREERADLARSGEADSDLAHATRSFFSTAHATFVHTATSYSTLQIHGFRDELLPQVSAVVSAAGTNAPAGALARRLQAVLGREAVRLYPSQVKQLGGTHNVQAQLSKASGSAFIHLELSRSLRDRLRADPEYRRTFAATVKAGLLEAAKE
ncbi:MAG TPA: hypothetical protein VJN18_13220 [Polyangiaceae bacterium]|nr:hypothetical protein [Polyangiaceae bacterium]